MRRKSNRELDIKCLEFQREVRIGNEDLRVNNIQVELKAMRRGNITKRTRVDRKEVFLGHSHVDRLRT